MSYKYGSEPLPALTRAGITHLYFVSIHSFEDGNGRIGRALAEKSLAEYLGEPTLIALSQTIDAKRKLLLPVTYKILLKKSCY
nr:Fic family protein [Candidatus Berkiella cookevillensis]